MSDTKHTTGPWHYEWKEYGGYDCMTSAYAILDAKGNCLVSVDCGDYKQITNKHGKSPTAEADARLIAAAPELLEWAKQTVHRLKGSTAQQAFDAIGQTGMLPALSVELEQAIAKAEA